MPLLAIITGFLLTAIGVAGYFATGAESPTALIPCAFGIILLLSGAVAKFLPSARKHAMHVAALISLLGFAAVMARTGAKIPAFFAGQPVEPSPTAVGFQLVFALVSIVFFFACLQSFVKARLAAKSSTKN